MKVWSRAAAREPLAQTPPPSAPPLLRIINHVVWLRQGIQGSQSLFSLGLFFVLAAPAVFYGYIFSSFPQLSLVVAETLPSLANAIATAADADFHAAVFRRSLTNLKVFPAPIFSSFCLYIYDRLLLFPKFGRSDTRS